MIYNESNNPTKCETQKVLESQYDTKLSLIKNGHWNQSEHDTYLLFFKENAIRQKGQRLFKRLSQIIGTRTPSQCRSHHQKFNPFKISRSCQEKKYYKTKQYVRKLFKKHLIHETEEQNSYDENQVELQINQELQ